jgi:hypothetical protein
MAPPPPPEYRGSHRQPIEAMVPDPQPEAPWRPPEVRRGRHWSAGDAKAAQSGEPAAHETVAEEPVVAEPVMEEPTGQHTGGHSVADLMSRLQVDPTAGGGGRRRRRDG